MSGVISIMETLSSLFLSITKGSFLFRLICLMAIAINTTQTSTAKAPTDPQMNWKGNSEVSSSLSIDVVVVVLVDISGVSDFDAG